MAEETEEEKRQRRISLLRADIYGIADAAITYSILNSK